MTGIRFPAGGRDIPKTLRLGLGPTQPPIQLMRLLRMTGDEIDHSNLVLRLRMRGAILHYHYHHHPSRFRP